MSKSGPKNYIESQRSIEGYFQTAKQYGFPVTLFVHPEVAENNKDLLYNLRAEGTCLGLHLHPYKFDKGQYLQDLGAYSKNDQKKILIEAKTVWVEALDQTPLYFRAGYFSANDNTFRILQELDFKGGSLSCPGRVLTSHYSVWSGAEAYPHRAHLHFRQCKGDSRFIEVPISVDFSRVIAANHTGQKGYEWLYIPANIYNHKAIVENLVKRFIHDSPKYPVIVTGTHNDEDYTNPENYARKKLEEIFQSLISLCTEHNFDLVGCSLDTISNWITKGSKN
jgi:peptidoglycan/xylan/chitin deacetylase (PgdA/CDA1 family)